NNKKMFIFTANPPAPAEKLASINLGRTSAAPHALTGIRRQKNGSHPGAGKHSTAWIAAHPL
ncbi:hypothetical protein, partial [Klebsiella pneumoniae]